MLNLEDVQAVLTRRRYRPGWTFRAYLGDTTRQIFVEIAAPVEDSYNPGGYQALDVRSPVPGFALDDELAFDKWLSWRLQAIEIHESQEWLRKPSIKTEGRWVPVFDPHREGADRDQWPIVKRAAG